MFEIVKVFHLNISNNSNGMMVAMVNSETNVCRLYSVPEVNGLFYADMISNPATKKIIPDYPTDFPKTALNLNAYPFADFSYYAYTSKLLSAIIRALSGSYTLDEDQIESMLYIQ